MHTSTPVASKLVTLPSLSLSLPPPSLSLSLHSPHDARKKEVQQKPGVRPPGIVVCLQTEDISMSLFMQFRTALSKGEPVLF